MGGADMSKELTDIFKFEIKSILCLQKKLSKK